MHSAMPVPAHADQMDELIAQLEDASHDATAKSEEIKALEDEIAEKEREIEALNKDANQARGDAERATGARIGYQQSVNEIAVTRYRNSQQELLLNTLESGNPQAAIDRAAYLGSLARGAERTLQGLNKATLFASERSHAVDRAVGKAERKREELNRKREELEMERDELDSRVREIEERVDNLNAEQRARWEAKDNPIDIAGIGLPSAPSGVVAAAMAQLGKPYGWGSTGPHAFDCSGLMVYAYAQNGIGIPRTSHAQIAGGTPVALNQLQPGDIIGYYPGVTHVGMYIGSGMVVHASDYGIPIQVVPYNSMPISGAVRY